MVVNWWWLVLSIVMFICFICCYPFNIRQIKKQFKNACFWTWYMKKDKETLTDEDILTLNLREWDSIFDQIFWCWFFSGMSILISVVSFLLGINML